MTTPHDMPSGWGLLRCPNCQAALESLSAELRCTGCTSTYPILLGIPVLMREPTAWRKRWEEGLASFVNQMRASEKQLTLELLEQELGARGQNRVRQVLQGLGQHREEIVSLLDRASLTPESGGGRSSEQGYSPETYFTLIHRDYGWAPEVDEFTESWTRLCRVLPADFRAGATLMLGAGTGRLAWQLAAHYGATPALALDINPLPFVVTALLHRGEDLVLTELPAHPRQSKAATKTRTLHCPLPGTADLTLVLADGLSPPFDDGTFDTVVTPWFVDQVPEDARTIPEMVNRLLKDGGSFICTGPFLYDAGHTKPSLRYCADEFVEFVRQAGFEVTAATYETEPYVASPLSTQGRLEHVLYLHARKLKPAAEVQRAPLPDFLRKGAGAKLTIPIPEGLDSLRFDEAIVTRVARMIDGTQTVLSITEALIQAGQLADDGTADAAVRGCLKIIFRAAGAHSTGG